MKNRVDIYDVGIYLVSIIIGEIIVELPEKLGFVIKPGVDDFKTYIQNFKP